MSKERAGKRKEESNPRGLLLRLPNDEYEAVKSFAYLTGSSMQDVGRKALLSYIASEERLIERKAIIDRIRETRRVALDKLRDM